MQPCSPGFCFQASAVGSELTCFGECVAARYLRGRPVADVDLPADGSDIEPAPESAAQLLCPGWTT
jgi:hypothetical protein